MATRGFGIRTVDSRRITMRKPREDGINNDQVNAPAAGLFPDIALSVRRAEMGILYSEVRVHLLYKCVQFRARVLLHRGVPRRI